jgi:hypothetical protein
VGLTSNSLGRLIREGIDMSVVDVRREAVAFHEEKLAAAKKQRDVILIDKRVASAAVDAGDQRARAEVARLGKQDLELGRLVISLERQVRESKKWLTFAEDQAAGAAAAKANGDAGVAGDKLFLVNTPHAGHQVRHRAPSIEALRARLLPGYTIAGEIFGANDAGEGGVVAAINPTGPSIMQGLLAAFGDELIAFLASRSIVGTDKTVVMLPENGREKMQ